MFIKLHTCFNTVRYTVQHFVWNDRNCTTLPYVISTFSDSWVCFTSFNFLNSLLPSSFSLAGVFWRHELLRSVTDTVRCPVIETITFSTVHQNRFSLSPFLSEDGDIYSPKSWFGSAWDDGLCPNHKHFWYRRRFPRRSLGPTLTST
jgi:hypothetical protein